MATLGRRIAGARHGAGLTQEELGGLVGVTDGAVRGWESDRSKPPINRLRRIAEATGKALSYFLGDSEEPDLATEVQLLRQRLEHIEHPSGYASPLHPGVEALLSDPEKCARWNITDEDARRLRALGDLDGARILTADDALAFIPAVRRL